MRHKFTFFEHYWVFENLKTVYLLIVFNKFYLFKKCLLKILFCAKKLLEYEFLSCFCLTVFLLKNSFYIYARYF